MVTILTLLANQTLAHTRTFSRESLMLTAGIISNVKKKKKKRGGGAKERKKRVLLFRL